MEALRRGARQAGIVETIIPGLIFLLLMGVPILLFQATVWLLIQSVIVAPPPVPPDPVVDPL